MMFTCVKLWPLGVAVSALMLSRRVLMNTR
jgi:hypothetical protein